MEISEAGLIHLPWLPCDGRSSDNFHSQAIGSLDCEPPVNHPSSSRNDSRHDPACQHLRPCLAAHRVHRGRQHGERHHRWLAPARRACGSLRSGRAVRGSAGTTGPELRHSGPGNGRTGIGAVCPRGLGRQAAKLFHGGQRGRRCHSPRPATQRGGGDHIRQHRRLDWQRPHRPRHAQHAGPDRPGHDGPVRPPCGVRGRPCAGRTGAHAYRTVVVGGDGIGTRCGHGGVGLGPGLCLLFH